jgi:DNA recombination-dependent growth factor C
MEKHSMWLKKFFIYQINGTLAYDEDLWIGLFDRMRQRDLRSGEKEGCGWVSPSSTDGPLFLHFDQAIWLSLSIQSRYLPASTLRKAVDEALEEMAQQGQSINAKVKREVKESVQTQMLTQAFVEHTEVPILLDLKNKYLLVGVSSEKQADLATGYLRKTIGALPVVMPSVSGVGRKLTSALAGKLPGQLSLANGVWMQQALMQTNKATFTGCDLPDSRVDFAVQQGMVVAKLSLRFNQILKCVINDRMQVSSIAYDSTWRLEHKEDFEQNESEEKALADMILLRPIYHGLVNALMNWLGETNEADELK